MLVGADGIGDGFETIRRGNKSFGKASLREGLSLNVFATVSNIFSVAFLSTSSLIVPVRISFFPGMSKMYWTDLIGFPS
jgi:hypothetical protein